jgi:hypothetical protein
LNFRHDFREFPPLSLKKGISGVTVRTPKVAGGKSDKNAGETGKGALPLQAHINLIDHQ